MASVRGRIFSMITSMQNINPSANPDAIYLKRKKHKTARSIILYKEMAEKMPKRFSIIFTEGVI